MLYDREREREREKKNATAGKTEKTCFSSMALLDLGQKKRLITQYVQYDAKKIQAEKNGRDKLIEGE